MEKSLMKQIWDAIDNGDCQLIKLLITENPEQKNIHIPFGRATWLGYAAAHGSLESVKTLIEIGLDVNQGSQRDNKRPICNAADNGRTEIVGFLLGKGAVLDTTHSIRNPLFAAIVGRSPETVKLLLEAGIDSKVRYNSKTMKNMDALAFARMQGEMECARIIALWNANGNETLAKDALEEAERIAYANTEPVSEEDKYYGVRES